MGTQETGTRFGSAGTPIGIVLLMVSPAFILASSCTSSRLRPTPSPTATVTATASFTATNTPTAGTPVATAVATFVAETNSVRIWEPVAFDARGTTGVGPLTFTWNFGDGNIARGREITHQFVQPGTYNVQLAVSNAGGTGAVATTVNVGPEPMPTMTYRASLFYPNCGGLWLRGNLAFIPQLSPADVVTVDVSNVSAPSQVYVQTGVGSPRETRAFNHYLLVNSEPAALGFAWSIVDVATPSAPVVMGQYGAALPASHTIGYWDNMVIVQSQRRQAPQMLFYDVSDPAAPTVVGSWSGSSYYVHDSQRVGNKIYVAAGYDGFYVLDITNPAAPTTILHKANPGRFQHNIWPSKNGDYVFTTSEETDGFLEVWNITNPANVVRVATWLPPVGTPGNRPIVHNVIVVGDYAYVAHYTYGLTVLDVSNPAAPTEIYHYDTYPTDDSSNYEGAWMVYPFGSRVYISDLAGGLFTFTK